MKKARHAGLILVASLMVPVFVACAATQAAPVDHGGPGFWLGLWHGLIAPVTFIVSLFANGLRIYAYPNAGLWYDFGFMLGIGGFSGGVFAGSRSRRK